MAVDQKNPAELLTPEQVSELLGVAPSTLSRWRCTGARALPYVKVGHLVRYMRKDVEDWIQQSRQNGQEDDEA